MPEPFEIRNPELEGKLKGLAAILKQEMPEGWGFTLLVTSYGKGGSTFYASSVEREDAINLMKEFITRMEAAND